MSSIHFIEKTIENLIEQEVDKEIILRDVSSIKYAGDTLLDSIDNILDLSKNNAVSCKILVSSICDCGAYFTGVTIGKHKLCPKISPKKTVEGAIGGIVFCIGSILLYGLIIEKFIINTP